MPELLPIRYGRMLVSPFTFYRGAAAIMAVDLADTPRSGVTVQLCGDAHLSNFGLFGTPERQLIFDINDFDETLPGPWEWDVKRLAASFEVMGRDRGLLRCRSARGGRWRACTRTGSACARPPRPARSKSGTSTWRRASCSSRSAEELRKGQLGKKEAATVHGSVVKARTRDSVRVLTRRVRQGRRRASDRRRPSAHRADRGSRDARLGVGEIATSSSRSCSRRTAGRSESSTTRSRSSVTSTRRAKWSGSEASAPAATSCLLIGRDDEPIR